MTEATTRDLVESARDARRAVAAFNVITLEHAEAIVHAAEECSAPVILQVSQNAIGFHGGQVEPLLASCAAVARLAEVPVAVHLDHVTDDDLFGQALKAPVSSVMYDAGALPFAENVDRTARAAVLAHGAGLWLEAELGFVGGKPGRVQSAHQAGVRTDPDEAVAFVAATGVDALAVAVGSQHAMRERSARIDVGLVAELRDRLDVPLVLHGSSGVPHDQLRSAVAAGICKVNVGTALNVAMTTAVRSALVDPDLVDPRSYLTQARDAMAAAALKLLDVLASVS